MQSVSYKDAAFRSVAYLSWIFQNSWFVGLIHSEFLWNDCLDISNDTFENLTNFWRAYFCAFSGFHSVPECFHSDELFEGALLLWVMI